MIPETLRELFTYNDWATHRLLDAAAERTDPELDQSFEMGEGSLRKTLTHLWGAEEVWLQRWKGLPVTVNDEDGVGVDELRDRFRNTAAAREAWLETQDSATMEQTFRYKRPSWMEPGPDIERPFGISILHVINHAPHHRAQAINMLKRVGAKPPTLDYIVTRLDGASPDLDAATLRRYLQYGDWAHSQVHQASAGLSEEARNREFPIGPGTLRRVLRHLADAPRWWVENLKNGPGTSFPAIEENDTWDELWTRYQAAATDRDRCLDGADLKQPIAVITRGGPRSFPLGVAMLQVCVHGTHHRAQALNMLRHAGAKVPELDVAIWYRQGAPILV